MAQRLKVGDIVLYSANVTWWPAYIADMQENEMIGLVFFGRWEEQRVGYMYPRDLRKVGEVGDLGLPSMKVLWDMSLLPKSKYISDDKKHLFEEWLDLKALNERY